MLSITSAPLAVETQESKDYQPDKAGLRRFKNVSYRYSRDIQWVIVELASILSVQRCQLLEIL